jgi:hypothetical protein
VSATTCIKKDIDECNAANICHPKANCINYDATDDAVSTNYECKCPTGWNGDGVTSCDVHVYNTRLRMARYDITTDTFVESTEIANMKTSGVIPPSTPTSQISATAAPYYGRIATMGGTTPSRRSIVNGVEISVTIVSDSEELMNTLTSTIDLTSLPSEYAKLSEAVSEVAVGGRGVITTMMSGFAVDTVAFSAATNTWEIDCRYMSDVPNTVTSPFISKVTPQNSKHNA